MIQLVCSTPYNNQDDNMRLILYGRVIYQPYHMIAADVSAQTDHPILDGHLVMLASIIIVICMFTGNVRHTL